MKKVYDEIFDIMNNDFDMKLDRNNDEIKKMNLFCSLINFDPRDMIYLMLLLERKFNIKFQESDFENNDFYTIKGISEIITSYIHA